MKESKELNELIGNFQKIIEKELINLVTNICKDKHLNEIYPNFIDEKKTIIKKFIKKNSKNSSKKQCIAFKKDKKQCTRKAKDGYDFCGRHIEKQTYGIISKKKINQETQDLHIPMKLITINSKIYLIDDDENVYTNNISSPTYLGKKDELLIN